MCIHSMDDLVPFMSPQPYAAPQSDFSWWACRRYIADRAGIDMVRAVRRFRRAVARREIALSDRHRRSRLHVRCRDIVAALSASAITPIAELRAALPAGFVRRVRRPDDERRQDRPAGLILLALSIPVMVSVRVAISGNDFLCECFGLRWTCWIFLLGVRSNFGGPAKFDAMVRLVTGMRGTCCVVALRGRWATDAVIMRSLVASSRRTCRFVRRRGDSMSVRRLSSDGMVPGCAELVVPRMDSAVLATPRCHRGGSAR